MAESLSLDVCRQTLFEELRVIDRLVHKNSNQHKKTKYFQRLKHARGSIRALLERGEELVLPSDVEKSIDILVGTAEIFTILLGRSYFMPFALVSIAILAKMLSVLKQFKDILHASTQLATAPTSSVQHFRSPLPTLDEEDEGVVSVVRRDKRVGKNGCLDTSFDAFLQSGGSSGLVRGNQGDDVVPDHAGLDQREESLSGKKAKKVKKEKKEKKRKRHKNKDEIDDIFSTFQ